MGRFRIGHIEASNRAWNAAGIVASQGPRIFKRTSTLSFIKSLFSTIVPVLLAMVGSIQGKNYKRDDQIMDGSNPIQRKLFDPKE